MNVQQRLSTLRDDLDLDDPYAPDVLGVHDVYLLSSSHIFDHQALFPFFILLLSLLEFFKLVRLDLAFLLDG